MKPIIFLGWIALINFSSFFLCRGQISGRTKDPAVTEGEYVFSGFILNKRSGRVLARDDNGNMIIQNPSSSYSRQQRQVFQFRRFAGGSDPDEPYYVIVSRGSNRVLDVPNGDTDAGIQIQEYSYHGGPNQRWKLEFDGSGLNFHIRNVGTKKYLDVSEDNYRVGSAVVQDYYDGTGDPNTQFWIFV
jgi:hypothetical protein